MRDDASRDAGAASAATGVARPSSFRAGPAGRASERPGAGPVGSGAAAAGASPACAPRATTGRGVGAFPSDSAGDAGGTGCDVPSESLASPASTGPGRATGTAGGALTPCD